MVCCALLCVNSSFCNHLDRQEMAGYFGKCVSLVSCVCYVTLPHGAKDLCEVL